jgi:hypothetical protein
MQYPLVGELLNPAGQPAPTCGIACARVLRLGEHVPLVGELLYPAGQPAPTCGISLAFVPVMRSRPRWRASSSAPRSPSPPHQPPRFLLNFVRGALQESSHLFNR